MFCKVIWSVFESTPTLNVQSEEHIRLDGITPTSEASSAET